jgi:hypothetical protein
MKTSVNLLLFLFFILFQSQVSGQAFKLEELAAFNTLDMATFKAEIKKHTYTFYDKTESPAFILFEYEARITHTKSGNLNMLRINIRTI